MVFSSISFIFYFLPLVLAAYFIAPNLTVKNIVLLTASLLFYAWGEPIYISLMLISALNDYVFSNLIQRNRDRGGSRALDRCYFVLSIIVNLSLLGIFKYADFAISTVNSVFGWNIDLLKLPLPIGISFYTFQTMSYSIDVYMRKTEAQKSFLKLATYVTLFPQLIAGPIVRYKTVEHELSERHSTLSDVAYGLRRFVLGLAKKVLLADTMGHIVDAVYTSGNLPNHTLVLWLAAFAFAFQVYYDFSGYSDMAIGLGRIFGFHFLENFNYPFMAQSQSDFWRRWHMSLGTWFRDYVYIPLGGNRKNTFFNLAVVWILTGIWHGANWNFILWGIYCGTLLAIEKFLIKLFKNRIRLPYFLRRMITMFTLMFLFPIFALQNFDDMLFALTNMLRYHHIGFSEFYLEYNSILFTLPFFVIAALTAVSWREVRERRKLRKGASVRKVVAVPIPEGHSLPGIPNAGITVDLVRNPDAAGTTGKFHHSKKTDLTRSLVKSALYDVWLYFLFFLSIQSIVGSGFHPFFYFRF